ncbi:MAG: 30S ribosomal protein S4 [Methanomassiliicoccales archaeon]
MGDPKFPDRKYERPSHPWEGERIHRETNLVIKYGLKNKQELWRAQSRLREIRRQARILQARNRTGDLQSRKETEALLKRCIRLGLVNDTSDLNDLLLISIEDILSRRLQTVAFKKGLARTITQARQFIVHGHISLGSRRLTVPGYMLKRGEEENVSYTMGSPLSNDMHPMRPEPGFVGVLKEPVRKEKEGFRPLAKIEKKVVEKVAEVAAAKEIPVEDVVPTEESSENEEQKEE